MAMCSAAVLARHDEIGGERLDDALERRRPQPISVRLRRQHGDRLHPDAPAAAVEHAGVGPEILAQEPPRDAER